MNDRPSYSFLPFLRQGLINSITSDENAKLRATIQVEIELEATKLDGSPAPVTISRPIQLYGPGDILGIDSRTIVRTEPRNWITNFEPNYLAFIEFYDEDFPWRYTPLAPDTNLHRLRPWIMLVVLKEDEFEAGVKQVGNQAFPFIKLNVAASNVLPPADQLWAWAHVHVNRSLILPDTEADIKIVSTDQSVFLPKLQEALKENADLAYSRIVCPRHLEENTAYHAFLVPSFETGRLAGLGEELKGDLAANQSAWDSNTKAELELAYYHRWYFRTGTVGDFEYLVRLLKNKPVDKSVGARDMDVQDPGANLPGVDDDLDDLDGILKLGGALRVPKEDLKGDDLKDFEKYDNWDNRPDEGVTYPRHFQQEIAKLINLADDYAKEGVEENADPVITPPIYGRWHALTERLLTDRAGNKLVPNDNWVHNLNLDPRYRVTAGFGTRIVQEKQEEYVDAAWEQIGDVLEANRRIRQAQLAKEVAWIWYEHHLKPLFEKNFEKALMLTAPVHRRVVMEGFTIHHHFSQSVIPPSLISTAMRTALRPGGRLMRTAQFKDNPSEDDAQPGNLLTRINSLKIQATPPKLTPPGLPTTEDISDRLTKKLPGNLPPFLLKWLRHYPWLVYVPLALIVVVILLTLIFAFTVVCVPIGIAVIGGLWAAYRFLNQTKQALDRIDSIRPDKQTPDAVDHLPLSPDFHLSQPEDKFIPTIGTNDSVEAQRFKTALRDANLLFEVTIEAGREPERKTLNLAELGGATMEAIDPDRAIPQRVLNSVLLPERITDNMTEGFKEAWGYPEFDTPMYKPLVEISSDLFLPNIQRIEQNSITLLETNPKFIEAYMMGLNHEFARELLWREYPTDQRGSYFRQFWDVSSFFTDPNLTAAQRLDLKEKLRDIPAIHRWSRTSKLGQHDNRAQTGTGQAKAVLVIRGELLKKYPTAVIYAHRAKWQTKSTTDSTIDKSKIRQLDPPFDQVGDNPSREFIKTPLYEAKVEPDIYFFGFDLTIDEAKGETKEKPDDPGWFFVIKDRPGEPRFGLDINKQTQRNIWNDLSWEDVLPGAKPGAFITISNTISLPTTEPTDNSIKQQYKEDIQVAWSQNTNSADLAYILYQTPVLVAIHAAELLSQT